MNTHALSDSPAVRPNYSLRSTAKNGGSEGSARQSAIHHQLDRVDVRRIVRGKKKHSLGHIFRLAPTGKWNRGREEVGNFCGFLCRGIGAPRASRWESSSLPGPPRSRESCAVQDLRRWIAPSRRVRLSWQRRQPGLVDRDNFAPIR